MPRHNNPIPDTHGKKDQVKLIKVNFNQPAKAAKRRLHRIQKAKKLFPRPLNNLRPAVQCESIKHNARARLGRGFSLEELRVRDAFTHTTTALHTTPTQRAFSNCSAGSRHSQTRGPPTIGITVDFRRRNHNEESFRTNVRRLKLYKSKLVLFPRGASTRKSKDPKVQERKAKKPRDPNAPTRADLLKVPQIKGVILPLTRPKPRSESMKISDIETKQGAYSTLRAARAVAKTVGARKKWAEKKAAETKE